MPMIIVKEIIKKSDLAEIAKERYGDLVKAVVDVDRKIMAIGGELHSDEEGLLLDDGSLQKDLWGINLYPNKSGDEFIEYDSIINIRPSHRNRSRDVLDPEIKQKIIAVIALLVEDV